MSETPATAGVAGSVPGYVPPAPVPVAPLFAWPPQPRALAAYFFGFPGYLWPFYTLFIAIALVSWTVFSPTPAEATTLEPAWIGIVALRNAALLVLISGTLYLCLYVLRTQGTRYKYNASWPARDNPRFLFGDQVRENVFWNFASAVPIWTAYEAIGFWLHGNGYSMQVSWAGHPLYCALLVLLIPVYGHVHFWAVHRALHWPPLYRAAHYLHHKNVNINTWSGLSMHPLEHLMFFSGALLFYVIPAHPFHLVLYLHLVALSTAMDHSGFHRIVLPGGREFDFDFYMHYLHHRYFEVNYAADTTFPMDVWQGTFHDGTPAGLEALRRRRQGHAGQDVMEE